MQPCLSKIWTKAFLNALSMYGLFVHTVLSPSFVLFLVHCFPVFRFLHIFATRMFIVLCLNHHQLVIFTVILFIIFLKSCRVFVSQIVLQNRCGSRPFFLSATIVVPITFMMFLFHLCRGLSVTVSSNVKHISYAYKCCKCNLCSRRRRFHILEIHKRQERFVAGRTCAVASTCNVEMSH